jgi:sodium transport system ATP-binding protein
MCLKQDSQNSQAAGIEVIDLSKEYPGVTAVGGISLTVEKGSIVGLLGPNGAGKTTTLRMLAGILRPSGGTISICGFNIDNDLTEIKKRIGFLSGDTQLYERLTVKEVLRFFGQLHQIPTERLELRIDRLVDDFGMADFADRRIGTLSTGQKQRANIARTIVHDPNVLILDEITASLDIVSSQFVIETLKELKRIGKAILFSTHIMSEAEYLCDQISLIYGGRIIDRGTLRELTTRRGCDNLTAAFLDCLADESLLDPS